MPAQSNPSLPVPLAANAIAIDLCGSLYILPLPSQTNNQDSHLISGHF